MYNWIVKEFDFDGNWYISHMYFSMWAAEQMCDIIRSYGGDAEIIPK